MLFSSKPIDRRARSPRVATAVGTDRLRVMISKSANFTFSVTVLPRLPVDSQCRQTLSKLGSQSIEFFEVCRERAFRADGFPDSVGRTGPSSMPREIQ